MVRESGCGRVAEGTVEDLAGAVRAVLRRRRYGRRARETARRDFAMSAVANRLLAVYRQAVTRCSAIPRLAPDTSIFIAGLRGLVGSALVRHFSAQGFGNLLLRSSAELDLRDTAATAAFFAEHRPEVVIDAAALVGGIGANSPRPADFISDNLRIQVNLLDSAVAHGVQRFLFLGSSCIYPKFAAQPIAETALLSGALEETNEAYAMAKLAGITHVTAIRRQHDLPYICAMPTNLYGPGDNFNLDDRPRGCRQ